MLLFGEWKNAYLYKHRKLFVHTALFERTTREFSLSRVAQFPLEHQNSSSTDCFQYLGGSWLKSDLKKGPRCNDMGYFLIWATAKCYTSQIGYRDTKVEELALRSGLEVWRHVTTHKVDNRRQ